MKKILIIVVVIFVVVIGGIFIGGYIQQQNNTNKSPAEKTYTTAEIAKHNTITDCWLIINNNVYDISKFIDNHPRGDKILPPYCGKESTTAFDTKGRTPAREHSAEANNMLVDYLVGKLQ